MSPTQNSVQISTRGLEGVASTPAMTTTSESPTTLPFCEPQKYVVFLKTHKTGSSTITNILNRFADANNLTILLPNENTYSFNWPNKFRLGYARDTHGKMPHILANHARYSRKSMHVLFPREKTAYITILRDPVKQWESTFSYMSFPYILNIQKKQDPLDFFLKHPPSMANINSNARRFPSIYLIKNPLFFDLGLDYRYYENTTMIKRALKTIDNDFDLVLMMEHFDESMVLLKRRLCWDIDDVIFFKTNERLNKNKRRVMTGEQQAEIRKWNNADASLYDFFIEKFWKEIEKEGTEFYDDLEELKKRKKYYFDVCVSKETVTKAYSSVFVKGYEMRRNLTTELKTFCERMLRNELSYLDHFKAEYTKAVTDIEGDTIENFDDQLEEAEIQVEQGSLWGEDGAAYRYGIPTKKPIPTRGVLTNRRIRQKKLSRERDLGEKTMSKEGVNRSEIKNSSQVGLKGEVLNTDEKNGQKRVSDKANSRVYAASGKTPLSTKKPATTAPTMPITLEMFKKDKLTTLQKRMKDLERTTEEMAIQTTALPSTTYDKTIISVRKRTKAEETIMPWATSPTRKIDTKKQGVVRTSATIEEGRTTVKNVKKEAKNVKIST